MTPDHFARVEDLFARACDLPPADRAAFLQRECAHHPAVLAEVERLLDAQAASPSTHSLRRQTFGEPPPAAPRATPAHLGRFAVERLLGEGGMGAVYRARDPRLDRTVALKVLPDRFRRDPARVARLEREARALAALDHPGIATIYSLEQTDDGRLVLLMECLEGRTLAALLADGPLDPVTTVRTALTVASALEAAHDRGIIHRDLKPGNIMLLPDGRAKVLDFGLARALHAHEPPSPHTPAPAGQPTLSDSAGTPGYMSPEQARGEPQDGRTDLFALGAVLFECLTGRRAFPTPPAHPTRADPATPPAPDLAALPPSTPPPLRDLIERCLAADPAGRPASASACRAALAQALQAPVAPSPAQSVRGAPRPAGPFVGRHDALIDLVRLVRTNPLVTLTGPIGVGKTRLAIEAASLLAPEFEGGASFLRPASTQAPPGGPAITVLDASDAPLDTHRAAAEALLAHHPGSRVIATSPQPLGIPGEQLFRVAALALPPERDQSDPDRVAASEAGRLFVDRARLANPAFRLDSADAASAITRICAAADGLPLAIEAAAARAAAFTPREAADRADDWLSAPAGTAGAGVSLRDRLDRAIGALPRPERTLLQRTLAFRAGWTLAAAEHVCADADTPARLDGVPIGALLETLVTKSLVERALDQAGSRYRVLNVVAARARAAATPPAAHDPSLRSRHLAFYLHSAEAFAPKPGESPDAALLDRIAADHDNYRAALESALALPEPGDAPLRLCLALFQFWQARQLAAEGRDWLQRAATCPGLDALSLLRARNAIGMLAWSMGDADAARREYQAALHAARSLGDARRAAALCLNLAIVAQNTGDHPSARALYDEAATLYRELGDDRSVALVNANLAGVLILDASPGSAADLLESVLPQLGAPADAAPRATALGTLGEARVLAGRPREALHALRAAVALRFTRREPRRAARALVWAAAAAAALGRFETAGLLLGASDARLREGGPDLEPTDARARAETAARTRAHLEAAYADELLSRGGVLSDADVLREIDAAL